MVMVQARTLFIDMFFISPEASHTLAIALTWMVLIDDRSRVAFWFKNSDMMMQLKTSI